MSDVKFVSGLFVDKPHEKAPDFVKCRLSFKAGELCQYLKQAEQEGRLSKGYLNVDVLESRTGKWYAKENDFKPQQDTNNQSQQSTGSQPQQGPVDGLDDDIPF